MDEVEPRIRELLQAYPTMPATVIAERIGGGRGLTILKDRVRELGPAYLPPDPASRTAYAAGQVAQCDFWFPPVPVPVGTGQDRTSPRLPVLTMVSGYSRWLSAVLVPSRHAADLFAGWLQLILGLGAVPRVLVWDGEGAIGRHRGGMSEFAAECQAFRGTLGTRVIVCRPADPESEGLVEWANGYLETSVSALEGLRWEHRCACAEGAPTPPVSKVEVYAAIRRDARAGMEAIPAQRFVMIRSDQSQAVSPRARTRRGSRT